jgi:ABC-type sugar transport system ATPase subunit
LSCLSDLLTNGFISHAKEKLVSQKYFESLHIKSPDVYQSVDALSGGNRQKVVLARWLAMQSKLLIFDEPTAGIDVGIKYEIYSIMQRLAADGIGVIMISSDLSELLGMCDRILVMCNGRLTGELMRSEATQERILALATAFAPETKTSHENILTGKELPKPLSQGRVKK